jgi:hypothetical protein
LFLQISQPFRPAGAGTRAPAASQLNVVQAEMTPTAPGTRIHSPDFCGPLKADRLTNPSSPPPETL